MKKILIAFDGIHFPQATLDFAWSLHLQEPILLTGIFLSSTDYAESVNYLYYGTALAPLYIQEYNEGETAQIKANMEHFRTFCQTRHISYKIHERTHQHITTSIQEETRYADLLILSGKNFYENLGNSLQKEYLTDTLHKAECPIILLPENYVQPQKIILAYDGSETAMHAIKQFSYLFTTFTDLETHVIYAEDSKKEIPYENLLREYISAHFSNLAYYKLEIDSKKYFNTWLENKDAALLVSGSYGRSAFSELFRRNFLREVVRELKTPLFIAHL